MSEFDTPGKTIGIQWGDYNGALLLFTVKSIEKEITTSVGVSDAVKASVNVLDGPNKDDGIAEALVFPRVLFGQLSGSVGRRVLGRLTQGNATPGRNAPWKLADPTEEDVRVASAWIAANTVPEKPPF